MPKTVARTVATPLEEQINGVEEDAVYVQPIDQHRQPET